MTRQRARVAVALVALVACGAYGVVRLAGNSAPRRAEKWPFASDSPWNIGVGAGAVFEDSSDPATASLLDERAVPWVNADRYSQPIVYASREDRLDIVERADGSKVRIRIPRDAQPASGSDGHLNVIDPPRRWVDEMWRAERTAQGWRVGHHARVDLWSSGVGTDGTRAYGGSAIAGLIRTWELEAGEIRHALAVSLGNEQLRTGPVWPATREDGDAERTYSGEVPMGAFAAIPADVDLRRLRLTRDGLILADALQRYGAYVVDRTDGTFALSAEPSVNGRRLRRLRSALVRLRPLLRVVENNGPDRVNGGLPYPAPRAPDIG